MKAVILSGGSGQRLAPLTNTTTKQLLPVANKPTLFHILEQIKEELPIKEICVVVSEEYGHQVKEELVNSEYAKYFKFDFVFQDKPLGLAHAVQLTSMHMKDDDFLMFLGDILIDKGELKKAYAEFSKSKSECLVLVKEVEDPRAYGIAEVNNGSVTKLVEKPQEPKSNLCLSGIYFFRSSIFYAIANIKPGFRNELEITDAIDFLIQHNNPVKYYVINSWWYDIGTPENMLNGNKALLKSIQNTIKSKLDPSVKITGNVYIEENVKIKNSKIIGPVMIGSNSVIENCTIGPNVSLGHSVRLENIALEDSIIRDQTKLANADCVIANSVFGKGADMMFSTSPNGKHNGKKIKYVIGDNTKCMSL